MKTHFLERDGYGLRIQDQGQGIPILFGHSLTFDSTMWNAQAPVLSERFRVLRIDLHGHGGSGAPAREFTLEDMADDIAACLDDLGIDRVGYVGHSMGGMVGMRFALRHGDRVAALALMNTSAEPDPDSVRDLFHKVNEGSRGKPSNPQTVQFVLSLMFSHAFMSAQPEAVKPYERMLYEPPDPDGVYRAAHAVIWRSNVLPDLNAITAPTLVITSGQDNSTPAHQGEAIVRVMGAEHHHLADAGHLSPVEAPAVVSEQLATHFGRHLL